MCTFPHHSYLAYGHIVVILNGAQVSDEETKGVDRIARKQ